MLTKHGETLRLEPPVDLNLVAARLGIEVIEREFVEQVDGIYLRIPGAPPIIAINNCYLKPYARKRFTLAHEIGHHLLGAQSVNFQQALFSSMQQAQGGLWLNVHAINSLHCCLCRRLLLSSIIKNYHTIRNSESI